MAKNPDRREPFFRFFAPDWRADVPLRRCSFAARGLWIDMLSLMHEGEPYGELRDSGQPLDVGDLVQLLGGTSGEVRRLLAELETRAVFSRREDGTIYSRRMTRDFKKVQDAREYGKGGGNPTLTRKDNPLHEEKVNPPSTVGLTQPLSYAGAHAPGTTAIAIKEDSELRSARKPKSAAGQRFDEALGRLGVLMRKPGESCRELLGKLRKEAKNNDLALFEVIDRAIADPPANPASWLMAAAKTCAAQHNGNGSLPLLPPAWPPEVTTEAGSGRLVVGGSYLEMVFDEAIDRGRLDLAFNPANARPLIDWLHAGIDSDVILNAIRRSAAWSGYTPPRTLAWFDKAVRELRA